MSEPISAVPAVALLQGGPTSDALSDAVKRIVQAAGVAIDWHPLPVGVRSVDACGDPMPQSTIERIKDIGLCIKPLLRTPVGGGYTSPNVTLRQGLGVFAGVRSLRSLAGMPSRYEDVDIILVRELTEGTYAGIEHTIVPGVVETIKVLTRHKAEQVIRFAFSEAVRLGRKQVTVVHKANIMKMSDGLFRQIGKEIAAEFPQITHKDIIADNAAMQMVARPEQFDVLVAGNLFGDILGDIGAGLVGSSLIVTSANTGEGVRVFEATQHVGGSTNDAGELCASPLALLMPAVDLLTHLGETSAVDAIRTAVSAVLARGQAVVPMHGGSASTREMADAIIAAMS
ncbi:MAG: NAD-dependent isocitrate dehydrogenase [Myxococcales bacterium]|nr:NAD-dependent isocitrate dehydrogenase [Myxococcales bacterium]